jgi:acyl carrier protein
MGLEGVEIVMAVEEAFDIEILDKEAETLRTPRDLIEVVMGKVGRSDLAVCLTQRAFHCLRRAFMRELKIKRAGFSLDVPMEQLLPVKDRKIVLAKICDQAGVAKPPVLVRPRWLVNSLFAVSLAAAVATCLALFLATGMRMWEVSGSIGVSVGLLVLIIGLILTMQKATAFPPRLRTVRGMARWLVANNPELIRAPPGQWSREQVAEKVREIVMDQLGLDNYREDARFVEDLGMN